MPSRSPPSSLLPLELRFFRQETCSFARQVPLILQLLDLFTIISMEPPPPEPEPEPEPFAVAGVPVVAEAPPSGADPLPRWG